MMTGRSCGVQGTALISFGAIEEQYLIFGQEERIHVPACVGHSGFAFERNPMASNAELVDAIMNGKPMPPGYACVSAADIANQAK